MTRSALHIFLAALAAALIASSPCGAQGARFYPMDVFIDSGSIPLAAWQVEVSYPSGDISLAGIEGGVAPFADPPYYDPKGLGAGRVVMAAFTLDRSPKPGRIWVATIHVMEKDGPRPRIDVRLVLAADPEGRRINAAVKILPRD